MRKQFFKKPTSTGFSSKSLQWFKVPFTYTKKKNFNFKKYLSSSRIIHASYTQKKFLLNTKKKKWTLAIQPNVIIRFHKSAFRCLSFDTALFPEISHFLPTVSKGHGFSNAETQKQ